MGDAARGLPSCAVVVATRDRPASLDRCLAALAAQHGAVFETVVVDNSARATAREVASRHAVRYLHEPVPGLSRARNTGVAACTQDVIAFTVDDAIPAPDWLAELLAEFSDPCVMAVTGVDLPERVETDAERLAARVEAAATARLARQVLDRDAPAWFERANFGGLGNGRSMAFRRTAFGILGGFDERLGRGALLDGSEEHRAFFALVEHGYRVVHTPRAMVRHAYPGTMPELRARYLKDVAVACGYLVLLAAEEPRHRAAVLRYALEALRGKRRAWRGDGPPAPRLAPRRSVVKAALSGPFLYLRSRPAPRIRAA